MKRFFKAHKPQADKTRKGAPPARPAAAPADPQKLAGAQPAKQDERPKEIGGPSGPEPTRYGDWERKGICVDF